MRKVVIAILLCSAPLLAQYGGEKSNLKPSSGGAGITAGDIITCEGSFNWNAGSPTVSDTLNGDFSALQQLNAGTNDTYGQLFFFGNSAAGHTDTITFSYTPAEAHGTLACQAWKNAKETSPFEDTGTDNPDQTNATGANASSGNFQTTDNGDLIFGLLLSNGVTATAGNGTVLPGGNNTGSTTFQFVEYYVQSTASSSTTLTFTNSSVAWNMGWGAIQSNGGTIVLDGSCYAFTDNGGTSSATVVVTISC